MKRYDIQQVMQDTHKLYNNNFRRIRRSWYECLKAAWIGSVMWSEFVKRKRQDFM